MKEFNYTIQDKVGIHARPAGVIVKKAGEFESKIVLTKDGKSAELTKLLALMALGVKCGDTVNISVEGPDEEKAFEEIQKIFEETL